MKLFRRDIKYLNEEGYGRAFAIRKGLKEVGLSASERDNPTGFTLSVRNVPGTTYTIQRLWAPTYAEIHKALINLIGTWASSIESVQNIGDSYELIVRDNITVLNQDHCKVNVLVKEEVEGLKECYHRIHVWLDSILGELESNYYNI
jgi:hypothetical protein